MTCVSLCHKDFKKHLLIKETLKNLSEYICRQLKQHQRKIRSKTDISLEITLNIFKCLISSLVPIKFLRWQQHYFYLLWLASCLWIGCGSRCWDFTVPSGRKGALFFMRAKMYTFSSIFIKKIWIFVCHYIIVVRSLLNWKKHKQGI